MSDDLRHDGAWSDDVGVIYRQTQVTLTDAEREAVERAIKTLDGWQQTCGYHSAIEDDAAALRGLLKRTK